VRICALRTEPMLRAGATQAPEPCRVEYGAASLQKVNRASPGACFDIGKRPRNLERAEREQAEAGVNTNRPTAVSILVGPQHCVGVGGGRRNVSITSMRAGTTSPGGKNLCVYRDLAFCAAEAKATAAVATRRSGAPQRRESESDRDSEHPNHAKPLSSKNADRCRSGLSVYEPRLEIKPTRASKGLHFRARGNTVGVRFGIRQRDSFANSANAAFDASSSNANDSFPPTGMAPDAELPRGSPHGPPHSLCKVSLGRVQRLAP